MKHPLVIFRPRERRLALGAGLAFGCWAFVSWVAQPLWDRARALRLHVEAQTEKLNALGDILAQGPSAEQAYQRVEPYLAGERLAQDAFLNDLEALARSANIQMNLKPRPMKPEGRLSRFEVELDIEASQDTLLSFLDALLGMPRLIAIERLRIASVPTKEQVVRANVVLQRFTFNGS